MYKLEGCSFQAHFTEIQTCDNSVSFIMIELTFFPLKWFDGLPSSLNFVSFNSYGTILLPFLLYNPNLPTPNLPMEAKRHRLTQRFSVYLDTFRFSDAAFPSH